MAPGLEKSSLSVVYGGNCSRSFLFFMSITDFWDAVIGSSLVRFYANGTKILKHIACFAGHAVLQNPSAILGQANAYC